MGNSITQIQTESNNRNFDYSKQTTSTTSMTDSKYDYESDSDDDYKEVIVNSGDFREEIYEFPDHRDLSLIKCIGQIKSEFDYQAEHEYKVSAVGTGTVYKVADGVAFILSCAHNIRHNIY
eukprot:80509_1